MKRSIEGIKKYAGEILEALIIVLVLFFVLFPAKVDGDSMEKTLNDGDVIFVSRAMAWAGMYDDGDIVVFKYNNGNRERRIVKRIAACEGDTAQSIDGQLYINGKAVEGYFCEESFCYELGKGEYFVIGDNSEESTDSREFGIVRRKDIEARAVFRLFPLSEIKSLL